MESGLLLWMSLHSPNKYFLSTLGIPISHHLYDRYRHTFKQLNMYDFHKVKQENDSLVFKNPLFIRGEQQKLRFIKRKASKKMGDRHHRRFYGGERANS